VSDRIWDQVLEQVRASIDEEDFRRWFAPSTQAGDSGDQIAVWVPSTSIRRHLELQYHDLVIRALEALGRPGADVRFVVTGYEEDDDNE
jgi:chromosomal replication initiation ATPase DnaA